MPKACMIARIAIVVVKMNAIVVIHSPNDHVFDFRAANKQ